MRTRPTQRTQLKRLRAEVKRLRLENAALKERWSHLGRPTNAARAARAMERAAAPRLGFAATIAAEERNGQHDLR